GTRATEGLVLKLTRTNTICLEAKAFKEMKKLRLLQLVGVQLGRDFEYISRDLRWLYWHGFPLKYIPPNFSQEICLKLVWKEPQFLERLKILNLSHSQHLTQTPDFSYLPNLEKLLLYDCPCLTAISETIEHLKYILLINLEDCTSLHNLPRSFYKLKSLKTLIISGCSMIDNLENDLDQMESLVTLIADKTAITQVPFSIVRSKSIGYVSLCGYEGFSRDVFPSLIWSWMSPTNNFSSQVETCMDLELVSSDVGKLRIKSLLIEVGVKNQVSNILRERKLSTNEHDNYLLPGDNYPDWLTFNSDGASIIFNVPHGNGRDLKTMTMCIVYSSSTDTISLKCLKNVLIINYTKSTIQVYKCDTIASLEDDEWQSIISSLEPGDRVEIVIVVYGTEFVVKKTSVYLIYGEPNNEDRDATDMPEDKNVISFGKAKNRFRGPLSLASVLVSPLFWIGVAGFLIWKHCLSDKRR
ncbi:hypothetical protein S83_005111, partial [Arachis hypogaea]